MEDLSKIIATTKSRQANVFRKWELFTTRAIQQNAVNIIESRFWQTNGMYLYLSGHSEQDVMEVTHQLTRIIAGLNPALIFLAPTDIEQLHVQAAKEKNRKWRESNRSGSWEEWGNRIYERQAWFSQRSLTSKDMPSFFNEWACIADKLFEAFPFSKFIIKDPQMDWEHSIGILREFIGISPN